MTALIYTSKYANANANAWVRFESKFTKTQFNRLDQASYLCFQMLKYQTNIQFLFTFVRSRIFCVGICDCLRFLFLCMNIRSLSCVCLCGFLYMCVYMCVWIQPWTSFLYNCFHVQKLCSRSLTLTFFCCKQQRQIRIILLFCVCCGRLKLFIVLSLLSYVYCLLYLLCMSIFLTNARCKEISKLSRTIF